MDSRSDLSGLLGRVEEATGYDGALERDVLDALFPDRHDGYFVHLQITASLDAALGLCERVLPGWRWSSHPHHEGGQTLGVHPSRAVASVNGPWEQWATHKQPALALLAAMLRALIAQGEARPAEPVSRSGRK